MAVGVTLLCDGCVRREGRPTVSGARRSVARVVHLETDTRAALTVAVNQKAVAAGWTLHGDTALCPECAKEVS